MKSKILFILHYPPPVHGSSVVGQYIKESQTINEAFDCQFVNLGTSTSIDEIGKNAFGKIFRYISIFWQVIRHLITSRPDLCYLAITAKGSAFYKDSLVILMVKFFRVKLVYHFHNKGVSTRQHKLLDNLLYRLVFKNADVILLSKLLYSDIQKYVPGNKVHYCPNGIPEQKVKSQMVKGKSDVVKIMYLSNLIESKGLFVLLEACRILRSKQLNFHCTFIGDVGDVREQQFTSKVYQLNIENCVTYTGKKYGTEKESELAKADIFAFPTYYHNECFPLVLLEAMQHGLPVVSTFEGGIPDVIEEGITGFLVAQKDSKTLAEKLELLIQNKDLREVMGEKGRLRYEQNFTLQHFEHNLNTILTNCLKKQKSKRQLERGD